MRKNRWFRAKIKHSVPVILCCLVSACVFAQQPPEQYLSPAIVENLIANSKSISSAFDDLRGHQDLKVQSQYDEYLEQIVSFGNSVSPLLPEDTPTDIAEAYRAVLQIYVPPEVKAVYLENGLGEQGHQVHMCLFLGIVLTEAKQREREGDSIPNKTRELLAVIESLIHPQDLALTVEYFKDLNEL